MEEFVFEDDYHYRGSDSDESPSESPEGSRELCLAEYDARIGKCIREHVFSELRNAPSKSVPIYSLCDITLKDNIFFISSHALRFENLARDRNPRWNSDEFRLTGETYKNLWNDGFVRTSGPYKISIPNIQEVFIDLGNHFRELEEMGEDPKIPPFFDSWDMLCPNGSRLNCNRRNLLGQFPKINNILFNDWRGRSHRGKPVRLNPKTPKNPDLGEINGIVLDTKLFFHDILNLYTLTFLKKKRGEGENTYILDLNVLRKFVARLLTLQRRVTRLSYTIRYVPEYVLISRQILQDANKAVLRMESVFDHLRLAEGDESASLWKHESADYVTAEIFERGTPRKRLKWFKVLLALMDREIKASPKSKGLIEVTLTNSERKRLGFIS